MKKSALILGVIFALIITACARQEQHTQVQNQAPSIEAAAESTPSVPKETEEEAYSVKEFDMVAKQWAFEPSTITVNSGDKVKLNIRSIDVTHGIALFEFGVNERLLPGETVTAEFTADKAGEYIFFCSVPCGRGHSDMRGTLIVK